MTFTADESCGKCTPCRIGSVRARELLERIEGGRGRHRRRDVAGRSGRDDESDQSLAHGARAPYPVLTAIECFGDEFKQRLSASKETSARGND